MTWRDRDDLSDTEVAILEMLETGRCTPAYIADEIDRSQEYVRERLGELRRLDLVESPYRGLYELAVDEPSEPAPIERESEPAPEAEPRPEPEPKLETQADQIEAIVDAVSASWDDDDRLKTRKAAARGALSRALDAHSVGKADLVEELREMYPVAGQSPDTYWRKNIQPVFSAMPTAHYEQRYTGWVVDGLCEVEELELE